MLIRMVWTRRLRAHLIPLLIGMTAGLAACKAKQDERATYFDERIAPILQLGCVQQTAGCHITSLQGTALGNLDVSSFDALMRRRDVLQAYGPYPIPLLLLKAGEPVQVPVEILTGGAGTTLNVVTDVRHNAGATVALDSQSYGKLREWMQEGYTRHGVRQESLTKSSGPCRNGVGRFPGFSASDQPTSSSYGQFTQDIQPILKNRCAGSTCHGSPTADLYLSCGDTQEELRWNYFVAVQHLTKPAASSELLRRPLAKSRGGTFHEGGNVIASTDDADYKKMLEWAETIATNEPELLTVTNPEPGFKFFVDRVQPVLVRKGCMLLGCHSPAMFHDLRYNGGSQGVFSRVAMRRNYDASLKLLALESSNPNASRLIAKNLFPSDSVNGAQGVLHRGGSLLEDFPGKSAALSDCVGKDADTGNIADSTKPNFVEAYCVLARWHAIERAARPELVNYATTPIKLVWVEKTGSANTPLQFDIFTGNTELRIANLDMSSATPVLGASQDLAVNCALPAGADIRTPAVSWDGTQIAFAARADAASPLRLYTVKPDRSDCALVPNLRDGLSDSQDGILIHDFDPAYAPDGRLVFASTRGNIAGQGVKGPSRTPSTLAPNANLYILENNKVRQLTFLLNQELNPNFMHDGRLIMSTEKRALDFWQIAGRRQNLDGADYHPLFAQRETFGFQAAYEIVELANRNLMMVASHLMSGDGVGGLAIVNRSLGPDQTDRDPADRFYQSSRFFVPSFFTGMTGTFRSPAPLPDGSAIVSCNLSAMAPSTMTSTFNLTLCHMSALSGVNQPAPQALLPEAPNVKRIETVAVYARPNFGVFESRRDEVNGSAVITQGSDAAVVTFQDVPLLGTLLFANTRTGRPIDARVGGLDIYTNAPPPNSATTLTALGSDVLTDKYGMFYAKRTKLGNIRLYADGSTRVQVPGGVPLMLGLTDGSGGLLSFAAGQPFTGEMIQREELQFYPGEQNHQLLPRSMFNGLCGGCHGSITGREVDVAVNIDVLTSASKTVAADTPAIVVSP